MEVRDAHLALVELHLSFEGALPPSPPRPHRPRPHATRLVSFYSCFDRRYKDRNCDKINAKKRERRALPAEKFKN